MRIDLAYGKDRLPIELPKNAEVAVIEPEYVSGLADQPSAILQALRQPINSAPLKDLVKTHDKVGIVFSDITRPTPNALILRVLLNELDHVPAERVVLLNSTGTHRPNTEVELREMLGHTVTDRYRIVQNYASDRGSHVLVGTTTSGNDVWIHEEYVDCDIRILTGFIEPHFFAGFSGGGKAVMPGLALLETVIDNHSAKNIDSPCARWGITHGNPVYEEVQEAARMVNPTFLLNVALNRDVEITGVFAGDLAEAHARGCAFAKDAAMVPVSRPFDIVVGTNSGYPLDLNLYQSVKGMSAAAQVVKEGGSIIIAADCWDGIPDHGEYGRMLSQSAGPESLLEMVRAPGFRRQDMWQAQIQALICLKATIYLFSHNLTDQQIRDAWLRPCHDIREAVGTLLKAYGPEARVCVLPEGPQTIPYIQSS